MKPLAFWSDAFFRDREPVRACVDLPVGWTGSDFTVFARHPRGTWTRWHAVATLDRDGEWSLRDDAQFHRWAFADFRFEATVHDGQQIRSLRSDIARHYARTVGFYGFGPVGERWSNAEVRRVARAVGGAAVRPRGPVALRRLARCVPPGEQEMRLFGYSLGGRAAVRLARCLQRRGVGVKLLVGIDPVDLVARTLTVPPNVRRAVSFYQRNGARIFLLPGPAGRGLAFTATDTHTTVKNHCLETWQPGSGQTPVMHEDMPRALREELTALLSVECESMNRFSGMNTI